MIDIMQNAVRQAGKILLDNFKTNIEVAEKTSQHDLVTKADTSAQQKIQEILLDEMKKMEISDNEIGFIGEEELYKPAKYTFVIDPLDGTVNYASGLDEFAVSIGLFIDGELKHGVIYQPLKNEIIYASKGKGAYRLLNGQTNKVTFIKTEPKNTMFCGSLSKDGEVRNKQINIYQKLFPHFREHISINAFVPSVFVLLDHTNSVGVIFVGKGYAWDIAAAKIIIEEAGGILVGWDGINFDLDLNSPEKTYPSLGCHPDNLQLIVQTIN